MQKDMKGGIGEDKGPKFQAFESQAGERFQGGLMMLTRAPALQEAKQDRTELRSSSDHSDLQRVVSIMGEEDEEWVGGLEVEAACVVIKIYTYLLYLQRK